MDQANEIGIIRHGRELTTDCVQREEESAIGHDPRMQRKHLELITTSQRPGMTPLTPSFSPGVDSTGLAFASRFLRVPGNTRDLSGTSLEPSASVRLIFSLYSQLETQYSALRLPLTVPPPPAH